jgi:hypothetical protein
MLRQQQTMSYFYEHMYVTIHVSPSINAMDSMLHRQMICSEMDPEIVPLSRSAVSVVLTILV